MSDWSSDVCSADLIVRVACVTRGWQPNRERPSKRWYRGQPNCRTLSQTPEPACMGSGVRLNSANSPAARHNPRPDILMTMKRPMLLIGALCIATLSLGACSDKEAKGGNRTDGTSIREGKGV